MSSSPLAVDVRGLSKVYRIKHNARRATSAVEALSRALRFRRQTTEQFWALKDATFQVQQGEVVGIIGHNGAGKSTVLKILSRIVEPTGGEAFLRGRLGSLLEVGTGFHPDLTGRENIFLNGAMLGMPRSLVQRQFDNIVEFSGVEQFLDTPVKRYSSGMYVRLAFSIAAHLDCDVLIVDEVLAVGDEAFQRKCLGKMNDVVGQGRTVLFVSHNMSAVTSLTTRSLVFEHGRVVFDGPTGEAIERYLGQEIAEQRGYVGSPRANAPAVTRVDVKTSQGGQIQPHREPLDVVVEVTTPRPVVAARLLITLVNRLGRYCAQSWVYDSDTPFCRSAGRHRLVCRFPELRLAPGQYAVRVAFAEGLGGLHDLLERVCPFEVVMLGPTRPGGWPVNEVAYFDDAEWSVTAVTDATEPAGQTR
jgi:lipopolysaccharide transport system ATP-binding protein